MKENTKYNMHRIIGKQIIDEIQPWFEFSTSLPWDEREPPWVVDNKVRRQILIELSKDPLTFEEISKRTFFKPSPLLITKEEYDPKVIYKWDKRAIENHLFNLEWYGLIKKTGNKYEINFPIFDAEQVEDIEKYVITFAEEWVKTLDRSKEEILNKFQGLQEKTPVMEIVIEKIIEKLWNSLKVKNLVPNEPNLRFLFGEQLRKVKFNEWVIKNFK
jgi:hypothetical protein